MLKKTRAHLIKTGQREEAKRYNELIQQVDELIQRLVDERGIM